MGASWFDKIFIAFEKALGGFRVWHWWPFPVALPMLVGIRARMRWSSLFDTERSPPVIPPSSEDVRSQRTADGSYNDLGKPWMGMAGARFGRNMPLKSTFGETPPRLYEPNPREVSNKLLARKEFIPASNLNILAAAWLQFMVHDWVSHGVNDTANPPHPIALPPGDDWPSNPMTILRSLADPTRPGDEGLPAAYTNAETHWWDASQLYGSSALRQKYVRTDPATGELCPDGKIGLKPNGHFPIEEEVLETPDAEGARFPNLELSGVNGNWWVGLSALHTIFAREHNCVIDRLKMDYPSASGEWLFQKARLIIAALLVKVQTVEWTPGLMDSAEGKIAMRSNWWGLLGEHYARGYGRVNDMEIVSGIAGSPTDHHAAPYSLTEEFVAGYRMHSLMPDKYSFRSHTDDSLILEASLLNVAHSKVPAVYETVGLDNVIYSLATANPGALALHNFPNELRRIPEKPAEGIFTDLAAVDILRDRERGVPRYCEFRRLLGMPAPANFEELTTDATWRAEIKSLYKTVEDVDLLVGTLAENRAAPNGSPPGFAFSDTVFRVFILMASRRLKSDRFYTTDFTPEVYTQAGWDWIQNNTLRTVIMRQCPSLKPLFADSRNIFFPWAKAGSTRSSAGVS